MVYNLRFMPNNGQLTPHLKVSNRWTFNLRSSLLNTLGFELGLGKTMMSSFSHKILMLAFLCAGLKSTVSSPHAITCYKCLDDPDDPDDCLLQEEACGRNEVCYSTITKRHRLHYEMGCMAEQTCQEKTYKNKFACQNGIFQYDEHCVTCCYENLCNIDAILVEDMTMRKAGPHDHVNLEKRAPNSKQHSGEKTATQEKQVPYSRQHFGEKPTTQAKQTPNSKQHSGEKTATHEKQVPNSRQHSGEKPTTQAKQASNSKQHSGEKQIPQEKEVPISKQHSGEKPVTKEKQTPNSKQHSGEKTATQEKQVPNSRQHSGEKPTTQAKQAPNSKQHSGEKTVTQEKQAPSSKQHSGEKPATKEKQTPNSKKHSGEKTATQEKQLPSSKQRSGEMPGTKEKYAKSKDKSEVNNESKDKSRRKDKSGSKGNSKDKSGNKDKSGSKNSSRASSLESSSNIKGSTEINIDTNNGRSSGSGGRSFESCPHEEDKDQCSFCQTSVFMPIINIEINHNSGPADGWWSDPNGNAINPAEKDLDGQITEERNIKVEIKHLQESSRLLNANCKGPCNSAQNRFFQLLEKLVLRQYGTSATQGPIVEGKPGVHKILGYTDGQMKSQTVPTQSVITPKEPVRSCFTCTGEQCEYQLVQTCNSDEVYCHTTIMRDVVSEQTIQKGCAKDSFCRSEWLHKTASNNECFFMNDQPSLNTQRLDCTLCCEGELCNNGFLPNFDTLMY